MRFRRRTDEHAEANSIDQRPMYGNGLHLAVTAEMIGPILEPLRAEQVPDHGTEFYVDWAGIRTRIPMLPWVPPRFAGTTDLKAPVQSDGYRSDADEYVALALSLTSNADTYRVVELGAGHAPWAVMGIACARRRGKHATGVAVEADRERASWAVQHAKDNDVTVELVTGSPDEIAARIATPGDIELLVVQAAVWTERAVVRFPVLDPGDMGGAASADLDPEMDYRGAHPKHVDVPAITLLDVLIPGQATDFMHVDLQGQEAEVLIPEAELVSQRVRYMEIGTHNRYVEGLLQEAFLRGEWALLMESPCTAVYDGVKPTLTGFTTHDGSQVWANSRFRDANPIILR